MSAEPKSTRGAAIAPPSAATLAIKRAVDIVGAVVGLVVLAPLLLAIATAIKLTSQGPVFFRQERIGRGGRPFRIFKFRSMVAAAPQLGAALTVRSDRRITRVGGFLRKYKLDELPQLINVVMGEMSLVGPRPEVPEFMRLYTPEQRAIIVSVRPGITDYASILFRDESALLDQADDVVEVYQHVIMPIKFAYYKQYTEEVGLRNDLRIIVATLWLLAFKHVPKSFGIEHELPSAMLHEITMSSGRADPKS
jgi:lipopolysaccharide/colanic/teichoic acid biosynthesis glycosyltransferase